MTLYDIDQQILQLIDENGEITDFEAFENLQMDRNKKIENITLLAKNMAAKSKAIGEEIKTLQARKKVAENNEKRLKERLAFILDGQKFETSKCSISYRSSESTEIEDAVLLAEWAEDNGYFDFVNRKDPEVDKKEIKKLLKQGVEVPFARLVESKNVTVK